MNGGFEVNRKITTRVSYLEIYNESVNDLLDPAKRNLFVRVDRDGGVIVEQLTTKEVNSMEEINDLLRQGEAARVIADTKVNSKSTRSHTVFRINIDVEDRNF